MHSHPLPTTHRPLRNMLPFACGLLMLAGPAAAHHSAFAKAFVLTTDDATAATGAERLRELGTPAVRRLKRIALEHDRIERRGRAVWALGQLQTPEADEAVAVISDQADNELVKTWARATLLQREDDYRRLLSSAARYRAGGLFALYQERLVALYTKEAAELDTAALLESSAERNGLLPVVAAELKKRGVKEIVDIMLRAPDTVLRQRAAMWAGTLGARAEVLEALQLKDDATDVPWSGGALFLPGGSVDRVHATGLIDLLVAWHSWCEERGRDEEQRRITRNVRSVVRQSPFARLGRPPTASSHLQTWWQQNRDALVFDPRTLMPARLPRRGLPSRPGSRS